MALTTNQNYVRDFAVAYDILYENISDQVAPLRPPRSQRTRVQPALVSPQNGVNDTLGCVWPNGAPE